MYKKVFCIFMSIMMFFGIAVFPVFADGGEMAVKEQIYPVVDGSTSTISLDAAFKSAFLGTNYNETYWQTEHSKTFESFEKLIAGEADIILSVPVTDEQTETAKTQGFNLAYEPVALEGFVFIVNPENPVSTLSQSQLRDIFAGKIKNWAEVGGENAEIRAYQRNEDSGSQSFMNTFMGDTPMFTPPTEWVYGGMGHLTRAISDYDNSKYAIGYTVYSYAVAEQAEQKNLKMIEVDGIPPTRKTFENHTYPLMSYTYAYYNGDTDNALVRDVIGFMMSDEGQKAASEYGYYPVRDIPLDPVYTAKGTGEPRPADWKRTREYSSIGFFKLGLVRPNEKLSNSYFDLSAMLLNGELADKETERKINDWVTEVYEKTGNEGAHYITVNGYMNVVVGVNLGESIWYDDNAVTSVWNLKTGERLEKFSDMFYEGSDFVPAVNRALARHNGDITYTMRGEPTVFMTTSLTVLSAGFDDSNNRDPQEMPINSMLEAWDYMPAWDYYDMKLLFTEEYAKNIQTLTADESVWRHTSHEHQLESFISYSRFLTEDEIASKNAELETIYNFIENSADYKDYDYYEDYQDEFKEPMFSDIMESEDGKTLSIGVPYGKYILNRETGEIDSPTTNPLLKPFERYIGAVDIDMDGTPEYISYDYYYNTMKVYDVNMNLVTSFKAYNDNINYWRVRKDAVSGEISGVIVKNYNNALLYTLSGDEIHVTSVTDNYMNIMADFDNYSETVVYSGNIFEIPYEDRAKYGDEVNLDEFNVLQTKIDEMKQTDLPYLVIGTGKAAIGLTSQNHPERYFGSVNINVSFNDRGSSSYPYITIIEYADPLGIGNTILEYYNEDGVHNPFGESGQKDIFTEDNYKTVSITQNDEYSVDGKTYGETQKDYHFNWRYGDLVEYGGIPVDEEYLKQLDGGPTEIRHIEADGGSITSAYYFSYNISTAHYFKEGMIIVNYSRQWKINPNVIEHFYKIYSVYYPVRSDQLRMTNYHSGKGTYLPSITKSFGNDFAVYPEKLPEVRRD